MGFWAPTKGSRGHNSSISSWHRVHFPFLSPLSPPLRKENDYTNSQLTLHLFKQAFFYFNLWQLLTELQWKAENTISTPHCSLLNCCTEASIVTIAAYFSLINAHPTVKELNKIFSRQVTYSIHPCFLPQIAAVWKEGRCKSSNW